MACACARTCSREAHALRPAFAGTVLAQGAGREEQGDRLVYGHAAPGILPSCSSGSFLQLPSRHLLRLLFLLQLLLPCHSHRSRCWRAPLTTRSSPSPTGPPCHRSITVKLPRGFLLRPPLPRGFLLLPPLPRGFLLLPLLPRSFLLLPPLPRGFLLLPPLPKGFLARLPEANGGLSEGVAAKAPRKLQAQGFLPSLSQLSLHLSFPLASDHIRLPRLSTI